MPSKLRITRISDRIKQDLSEMLVMGEVNDPRLTGIFITDVRVDRELAYADIFISAIEGAERSTDILSGLDHASGFLRSQLAAKIELRVFPRLRFNWDPTPEKAERIERLIDSISQTKTRKK